MKSLSLIPFVMFSLLFVFDVAGFSGRFAEARGKGYYAGPLSDTPETIERKEDLEKAEKSLTSKKNREIKEKPEESEKPEKASLLSRLRKVFGYD